MIDGSGSKYDPEMAAATTDVNPTILQRDTLHAATANQMHG